MPSIKLKPYLDKLKQDDPSLVLLEIENDEFDIQDTLLFASAMQKNSHLKNVHLKNIRMDKMQLKVILTALKKFLSFHLVALKHESIKPEIDDSFIDKLAGLILRDNHVAELHLSLNENLISKNIQLHIDRVVMDLYCRNFKLIFGKRASVPYISESKKVSRYVMSPNGKWLVFLTNFLDKEYRDRYYKIIFYSLEKFREQPIIFNGGTDDFFQGWLSDTQFIALQREPEVNGQYNIILYSLKDRSEWLPHGEWHVSEAYTFPPGHFIWCLTTKKLYCVCFPATYSPYNDAEREVQVWDIAASPWSKVSSFLIQNNSPLLDSPENFHELPDGKVLKYSKRKFLSENVRREPHHIWIYETNTSDHIWRLSKSIEIKDYDRITYIEALSSRDVLFLAERVKPSYQNELIVIDMHLGIIISVQRLRSDARLHHLKKINSSFFYSGTFSIEARGRFTLWYLDLDYKLHLAHEFDCESNDNFLPSYRRDVSTLLLMQFNLRAQSLFNFVCVTNEGEFVHQGQFLEPKELTFLENSSKQSKPNVRENTSPSSLVPPSTYKAAPFFVLSTSDLLKNESKTIIINGCQINIILDSIINLNVDAIVNSYRYIQKIKNDAVFLAAGAEQLNAVCAEIESDWIAHNKYYRTGITDSFALKSKGIHHIIHAQIPSWSHLPSNFDQNMKYLSNSFYECLRLAGTLSNIHTIGFPALGCGQDGFLEADVAKIALDSVCDFLKRNKHSFTQITFACANQDEYTAFCTVVHQYSQAYQRTESLLTTPSLPTLG